MCGIVGVLGKTQASQRLVDALKRLEYRGYDSAGIAVLAQGNIVRRRAEGKLKNLEILLNEQPLEGFVGIGHTRWATHGKPTQKNAHPHATEHVAVVHNGIIENYKTLREDLIRNGAHFESETDTEVVAHLVSALLAKGVEPEKAVAQVLPQLHGAFALAFVFKGRDDLMIGACKGSPLAVGIGQGEMFLGSDSIALAPFTSQVVYLEDGDWVVLKHASYNLYKGDFTPVHRAVVSVHGLGGFIEKGRFRHFMAKEIHEQSEVVGHTLAHYMDLTTETVKVPEIFQGIAAKIERVTITACGTAYYAGLTAKYWIEKFAKLPVDVEVASELRYREPPMGPKSLLICVSQSGETADTLAALRYAKSQGAVVAAVVNVPTSTIAREADIVLPTLAGPEIGVASTKAYTCQLAVLSALSVAFGVLRGHLSEKDQQKLLHALVEVPRLMNHVLQLEGDIIKLAKTLSKASDVLYIGRGTSFPLALEGALKLKEISYIHAEGYAAGELKHGPIALIDEKMPVIVIAPNDVLFEKTLSNIQEVAARGGRIILITDIKGAQQSSDLETLATFVLPEMAATIMPMVYAVPVQLIAYHTAVFMGTDVDQPRNLAKSVTVE